MDRHNLPHDCLPGDAATTQAPDPAPASPLRRVRRVAISSAIAVLALPAVAFSAIRAGESAHPATPASPSISVRATPHAIKLFLGHVAHLTVHTKASSKSHDAYRLIISGLPVGTSARLRPAIVHAGKEVSLSLRTSSATPYGRYTFHIRALEVSEVANDIATTAAVKGAIASTSIQAQVLETVMSKMPTKKPTPTKPTSTTPTSTKPTSTTPTSTTPTSTTPTSTTPTSTTPTSTTPTSTTPTSTTPTSTTPTSTTPTSTTPTSTTPTSTTPTSTTPTTTPPPASVPAHVPTWAYDDGCNGGSGASSSLVQSWLTFAESNCGPNATKAMSDCVVNGTSYCTPVQYLDANWNYPNDDSPPITSAAQENWYLHEPGYTDSGHRVYISANGGGYLMNDSVPAVQSWFDNYVQTNYNQYPALMMDDTSPALASELWAAGLSSTDEITTNSQLMAAHEDMANAITHANGSSYLQIDNALSPNDNLTPPFSMLGDPSSVEGLVAEGAPMSDGTLTSYYSTLLDEIAYVDNTSDDFVVVLSYDTSPTTQDRNVQTGTEWLGYDGSHLVDWSDLETNSGDLAVWPEEGVVPTDPVQSMTTPGGDDCLAGQGVVCSSGGHNDLEVASGVYVREFGECYNQGTVFGPCAAIMNTNSSPVTVQSSWLSNTYSSQITFNGGDVESGGTVDLDGAPFTAGTTTVPADDAILIDSVS